LFFAILLSESFIAQVSNETFPISWNLPLVENGMDWKVLNYIEPTGLLAEDALESRSKPMRFAKSRIINSVPSLDGRWSNLSNGDRIWKMGIRSQGSQSLSLLFSEFYIPIGARVYIYSEDKKQHLGPFTRNDNRQEGEVLVTPPISGDRLIVEYYEPFAFRGQGRFKIQSVQHGYRDLSAWSSSSSPCLDILSPNPSLGNISSSVLMMIVDNGQRIATGTMVNNSSQNSTPYLLTSLAALKGNEQGWVFLFDVTNSNCEQIHNCWTSAVCGATPVSVDSTNGTALVSLRSVPPGNWSVYYSGWDSVDEEGAGHYHSIQHAQGFVQSISNYDGELQSIIWNGYNTKRIKQWNSGVSSVASLGSPLFDGANNLVGVYVGGDLDCDGNGYDYFAEFSASFPLYNSYLDPMRSGINSLAGRYPIKTINNATSEDLAISFFPNPAREWIYIQQPEDIKLTMLDIYDAQGRLIIKMQPQTPTIELPALPEGLYTIHFVAGEKRSVQKLLIR
jgi:lysyl endopeptidase